MAQARQDFRVHFGFPRHIKTRRLMKRLGAAGPWHLICLWAYVGENHPSGALGKMDDQAIEEVADWPGEPGAFAGALRDLGWIRNAGSQGVVMNDWAEHQAFLHGRPKRQRASKDANTARWNRGGKRKRKRSDPDSESDSDSPQPDPKSDSESESPSSSSNSPPIPPSSGSGGEGISGHSRPEVAGVLRDLYGVKTRALIDRCIATIPDSVADNDAARWLSEQQPRFTTGALACHGLAQASRGAAPPMETFEDRERREAVAKGLTLEGYRLVNTGEIAFEDARKSHPAGYTTTKEPV